MRKMENQNEDENLLYPSSSSRESQSQCCIPQAQCIRIIGVLSCVSGLFITCLTLLCIQLHGKEEIGQANDPTRYLLAIGLISAIVSIWLLWNEGSRTAARIWTLGQVGVTLLSIIMFTQLLSDVTPNFDRLMQVLLSLTGINLCIVIFNVLVMIEFLMHPNNASKD